MKNLSIILTTLVLSLCVWAQPAPAAAQTATQTDNCSIVTQDFPALSQRCNDFYTACYANNNDANGCSLTAQEYVITLYKYDVCTNNLPSDAKIDCSNFDEKSAREELRRLHEYLEPGQAVIDVGAGPRTSTVSQNTNSQTNTSPSTAVTANQSNNSSNGSGGGGGGSPNSLYNDGKLSYTVLEPIRGLEEAQSGNVNFPALIAGFFKIIISFGAFLAVGALIFGGITYMVSDVVHKKSEALQRIQSALWGLLLLIASYLILYTINPQLTVFNLLDPTQGLTNTVYRTPGNERTNDGQVLTLQNNDPQRTMRLNNFCQGGSANPTPTSDGSGTQYTCSVYTP